MVQSLNIAGILTFIKSVTTPRIFLPHMMVKDVTCIDYKMLRDHGFKAIVFDKDNTLTAPYSNELRNEFKRSIEECKSVFHTRVLIVSNSAGTLDDTTGAALKIEKSIGIPVLRHTLKKPSGGELLMHHFKCSGEEIIVVGDRITTDIVYGKAIGALTILCTKIVSEKGDNIPALILRKIELSAMKLGHRLGMQLPKHPLLI